MAKKDEQFKESGSYSVPKAQAQSWQASFEKAKHFIENNVPIILFGPPGTGKTKMILDIKSYLESAKLLGKHEVIQFHKKFTYEDFIEGFMPDNDGKFKKRDGVFKKFCKEASTKKVDLFVIDEINRAELSTTLGEVLYLIEDRERRSVKTSHFEEEMSVPRNISIVGTMNTADRNIAIIDYALRRRFMFIPVFPDYEELKKWLNLKGVTIRDFDIPSYCKAAQAINHRLAMNRLMGPHMQLGHSMFVPTVPGKILEEHLVDQFQYAILPQLESYCGFGNEQELNTLLNTNIASKYLLKQEISFADISSLIRDLANESSS